MNGSQIHPLKTERKHKNLSQKALADFLVLTERTIQRAENGQTISADSRQKICDFFKKSPVELGLITDNENDNSVNRRQMLKLVGTASTILVGSNNIFSNEPWEQLSRALTRPSLIENTTVDNLASITNSYWLIRHSLTPQDLLHAITSHLQTITKMLQGSYSSDFHNKLSTIAGRTALFAGQTAFEIRDYQSALSYYKVALQAGQEGSDYNLQSAALGRIGFQMIYNREPQKALSTLQMASALPYRHLSNVTTSWLHVVEAEAHAILQNITGSLKLLDMATRTLDNPSQESEADPYWTDMNVSMLDGYKGACYLHLNQPDRALEILHHSLEVSDPSALTRRSIILTDMASAYVQQGEYEQGVRVANEALEICSQTKSVMVLERITQVKNKLEEQKVQKVSQDIDEQIRELI